MRRKVISTIKKIPYVKRLWTKLRRTKKRIVYEREKKKKEALLKKFGRVLPDELLEEIRGAGVPEGATLLVHSSYHGLYTFGGDPENALDVLKKLVGPSGTLLMPAFSTNTWTEPARRFNPRTEPTYAGLLNEVFRTTPGTLRSLHPRHSIAGFGPVAASLLNGHELCQYAEGYQSPMDRLRMSDDGYFLWLGVEPLEAMTFIHWIESIEPTAFPIRAHELRPVECEIVLQDGSISATQDWLPRKGMVGDRKNLERHLYGSVVTKWTFKGIQLGFCRAKDLADALTSMRDKGINIYKV